MRVLTRKHASRIKRATQNLEQPFEAAFSQLAHYYVSDTAPSLMPYEVGFQIVDRGEDNAKAIGIMAFKVGENWLYVPCFFDKGQVKGYDILFIKGRNLFVPLKDNWVNFFLGQKPQRLGESRPERPKDMGVMPPDLSVFKRSPSKMASAPPLPNGMPEWVAGFLPVLGRLADNRSPSFGRQPSLTEWLAKSASDREADATLALFAANPTLANAVAEIHTKEALQSAFAAGERRRALGSSILNRVSTLEDRFKPIKKASLKIIRITRIASGGLLGDLMSPGLSEEQTEDLAEDGVAFEDNRKDEETSTVHEVPRNLGSRLSNPTHTGVYDILVEPGTFERAAIFMAPVSPGGNHQACLVVAEKSKHWALVHPSEVWVEAGVPHEQIESFTDKLPKMDSPGRSLCVAVTDAGQATVPFSVESSDTKGPVKSHRAFFSTPPCGSERHAALTRGSRRDLTPKSLSMASRFPHQLVLTGEPGVKIQAAGDSVLVPKGARRLALGGRECGCGDDSTPAPFLRLASAADLQMHMRKSDSFTVEKKGASYLLEGHKAAKADALIRLVKIAGLRPKDAKRVLDRADEVSMPVKFLVKRAYGDQRPYPPLNDSLTVPYLPDEMPSQQPGESGWGIPTDYAYESHVPVVQPEQVGTNQSPYALWPPDEPKMWNGGKPDAEIAQEAAQTGQKEVIDTSVIGSVIKHTRTDSQVRDHLGPILRCCSALGELRLNLYWNEDQWKDRYGQREIPALDDKMRDLFEGLGDLFLELREKTVGGGSDVSMLPDIQSEADMPV